MATTLKNRVAIAIGAIGLAWGSVATAAPLANVSGTWSIVGNQHVGFLTLEPRCWRPVCAHQRNDLSGHDRQPRRAWILLSIHRSYFLRPQKPRWSSHSNLGRESLRRGPAEPDGWDLSCSRSCGRFRGPRRIQFPRAEVVLFVLHSPRRSSFEPHLTRFTLRRNGSVPTLTGVLEENLRSPPQHSGKFVCLSSKGHDKKISDFCARYGCSNWSRHCRVQHIHR